MIDEMCTIRVYEEQDRGDVLLLETILTSGTTPSIGPMLTVNDVFNKQGPIRIEEDWPSRDSLTVRRFVRGERFREAWVLEGPEHVAR